MYNADQQTESLRNVAYSADSTWTSGLCPFQRANMNLYLCARHVKAKTSNWARLTPRTVRDSIPRSRLAQYFNYEYDEARELSYSPTVFHRFERLSETFGHDDLTEPWMLEEIDDLYMGFLTYRDPEDEKICTDSHETLPCSRELCEMSYESPFFDATNFDEMALKLKTVGLNIKKLWDTKFFPYYGWQPMAKAKNLILFKSPACQMFASVKDETEEGDWLINISECEDHLSQIKMLTRSFKEQNTWIFRKQSSRIWLESQQQHQQHQPHQEQVDSSSNKRLYSAVLQGSSPSHSPPLSTLQFPTVKSRDVTTTTSTSTTTTTTTTTTVTTTTTQVRPICVVDHQPKNNSVGCSIAPPPHYIARTSVQTTFTTATPITTSVYATPATYTSGFHQYLPQPFVNPRLYSTPTNNFIPNTAGLLNFRQTNYYPLMLQNAAAPYMPQHHQYYQRSAFPSYRMLLPQRPQQMVVPSSSAWYLQPPIKLAPPQPLLTTRQPLPTYHYRSTSNAKVPKCSSLPQQARADKELENIVNSVVEDTDPYVPVTGVPSDELELQALEQYSCSSTNVFQELERQAAEQYETSENWRSPPKCLDQVILGGWGWLVRFRCALELACSSTVKAEVPLFFCLLTMGISDDDYDDNSS